MNKDLRAKDNSRFYKGANGVAEANEEAVAFLIYLEGAVCGIFEFLCASFFKEIALGTYRDGIVCLLGIGN